MNINVGGDIMKYCEDDVTAIRNIINSMEVTSVELNRYAKYLRLDDDERAIVTDGLYVLTQLVQYSKSLPDDKLGKIVKMKKFIKERADK